MNCAYFWSASCAAAAWGSLESPQTISCWNRLRNNGAGRWGSAGMACAISGKATPGCSPSQTALGHLLGCSGSEQEAADTEGLGASKSSSHICGVKTHQVLLNTNGGALAWEVAEGSGWWTWLLRHLLPQPSALACVKAAPWSSAAWTWPPGGNFILSRHRSAPSLLYSKSKGRASESRHRCVVNRQVENRF